MEQQTIHSLPPILESIKKNGLLLPMQVNTIHRIHLQTGEDPEILMLSLDLVSEKALQDLLGDIYGVESITDPFQLPTEDAVKLLSYENAIKYRCVPQNLSNGTLSVLFRPPIDPEALNKVGKKCKCYIAPNIITELRYRWLLHRFYNAELSWNLIELAEIVLEVENPHRIFNLRSESGNIYDPLSGYNPVLPDDDPLSLHKLPMLEEFESVLDDWRDSGNLIEDNLGDLIEIVAPARLSDTTGGRIHTLQAAFQPLDPASISEKISMVQSRDELPELFYQFGSRTLRNLSLYSCMENFIIGWTGAGLGLLPQRIEGIIVPEDRGTILSDIFAERFFLGRAASTFVNKRILSLFGADIEDTIIGGVVQIKERPVILVLGVIDDESEGPGELQILQDICHALEPVLIRIIRAKKSS